MLNKTLSYSSRSLDSVYRLSVNQYQAMIAKGIIDEDAKVELLEGIVSDKMPKNPPHTILCNLLCKLLLTMIPSDWLLRVESPIITESSMPEPDLAIVRGTEMDFFESHPSIKDACLIIEVADSSLERDQTTKKSIYAQGKVPIYWIVNLKARQIEVYSQPLPSNDYGERRTYQFDQQVPVSVDGTLIGELKLADYLSLE